MRFQARQTSANLQYSNCGHEHAKYVAFTLLTCAYFYDILLFLCDIGGREAWQMNYQVGFSKDGLVTALKYDFYIDAGCANDDAIGNLYMGMNWAVEEL